MEIFVRDHNEIPLISSGFVTYMVTSPLVDGKDHNQVLKLIFTLLWSSSYSNPKIMSKKIGVGVEFFTCDSFQDLGWAVGIALNFWLVHLSLL